MVKAGRVARLAGAAVRLSRPVWYQAPRAAVARRRPVRCRLQACKAPLAQVRKVVVKAVRAAKGVRADHPAAEAAGRGICSHPRTYTE